MPTQDILLAEDKDLVVAKGDFTVGESEEQHIELILLSTKGSWRQSPLTGCDLLRFVAAPFTLKTVDSMRQRMKIQLQFDGYASSAISINSFSDIHITAER